MLIRRVVAAGRFDASWLIDAKSVADGRPMLECRSGAESGRGQDVEGASRGEKIRGRSIFMRKSREEKDWKKLKAKAPMSSNASYR